MEGSKKLKELEREVEREGPREGGREQKYNNKEYNLKYSALQKYWNSEANSFIFAVD